MNNNPWISCPKPNPKAKIKLFCFPYSGANATIYYSWSGILPNFIEVNPIQIPGRGNRISEPSYRNIQDLAQAAAEALDPHFDKPFAFFGHSMGALVSFELARVLRDTSKAELKYLFVSGHQAPQVPDEREVFYNLPEEEFISKLRVLNGTPEEVLQDDELRELIIPVLRADFEACDTYIYRSEKPLECPICACSGLQDKYVSRNGLQAWEKQTINKFTRRLFPGDHFYINSAHMLLLKVIAQELSSVLNLPY
jgi:medium-chain acyl-[acyl-carrier-protein] hydrolase